MTHITYLAGFSMGRKVMKIVPVCLMKLSASLQIKKLQAQVLIIGA